jgi:hypothetical protein
MALAQTRTLRHELGLLQAFCFAAFSIARIVPVAIIRSRELRNFDR